MKIEELSKIGDLFIVTSLGIGTWVGIDVYRGSGRRQPGAHILDISSRQWGFISTRKAGWVGVPGMLIACADKEKVYAGDEK